MARPATTEGARAPQQPAGGGQLSTLHAIGQSLAIGPMLGVGS
jgi:hypothetical protein